MKTLFDNIMKEHGGILDDEKLTKLFNIQSEIVLGYGLDSFQHNLDRLKNTDLESWQTYFSGVDRMKVYYVNNSSLNAWAIRDPETGSEFIGLAYFTSLKIQFYISSLLSTKSFLHIIGNSKNEKYELTDKIKELQEIDNFTPKAEKEIPICPIRQKAAFVLWRIAMNFLFFHELGHHLRAHLLLLKKTFGFNQISEFDNRTINNSKEYFKLSQLIETDADRFATIFLKETTQEIIEFGELSKVGLSSNDFIFIACSILLNMFSELSIDNSLSRQKSHPHPAIRRINLLYFILVNDSNSESQFQKEIISYMPLSNSLEMTFSLLSKHPEYRRTMRQKDVVKNSTILRDELYELIENKLTKLIDERNYFYPNSC